MRSASGSGSSPRRLAAAAVVLVLVLLLVPALGYQLAYRDRVFPGVRVAGVEVGGLGREAAAQALAARLPAGGPTLVLRDPESARRWERPGAELGLALDPEMLADAAYGLGREGWNPLARLFQPLAFRWTRPELPAAARFDAARAGAALAALAAEVDQAPAPAQVREEGGRLVAVPGVLGHQLDISGTLRALALRAADALVDAPLDLAIQRTAGRLPALDNVALAYNTAVGQPLDVGWKQIRRFTVPTDTLKAWVSVRPVPNAQGDAVPAVVFDEAAMGRWLAERAADIERPAVNARFGFDRNGQVSVLKPGQAGLALDLPASVAALKAIAYTDVRTGELAVVETPPALGADDLERLVGVQQIGQASTSLVAAPPWRLRNLRAAAEAIDGLAVAPGGYQSLNAALAETAGADFDPVFLAAGGHDEAVTQACTTLLRTVWWLGLALLERHAPPYRLGWLEPPVGLDCALAPGEDLRFLNDTDQPLLFDAALDEARGVLTVQVYGQPLGRSVDVVGPEVTEVLPAGPPRVVPEPRLPAGARVQARWAREGATARLGRGVTRGGRVVARDAWVSRYAPVGDLFLLGGGAAVAPPEAGPGTPAAAPTAPPLLAPRRPGPPGPPAAP